MHPVSYSAIASTATNTDVVATLRNQCFHYHRGRPGRGDALEGDVDAGREGRGGERGREGREEVRGEGRRGCHFDRSS